jgi:diguanylate cyclase (GGDEF)-like protein/PAS domain S-box-containing protein
MAARRAEETYVLTRMAAVRDWFPTGGGLRDEDWAGRHRLLTLLLAASVAGLTVTGVLTHGTTSAWLITALLILPCLVAAVLLRPRRLPSMFVALGFAIFCGGFVVMNHGLTEAHFTFFIAVAALALYRDWAPFGMFLLATTLHHAFFGLFAADRTFDHHDAMDHPWKWAFLHALAVLLTAAFQLVGWRLSEAEEKRAQDNLDESQAQFSFAFEETPVPMAMIAPDGRLMRTNAAYRGWLGLPDELPAGFTVSDLPITPVEIDTDDLFERLVKSTNAVTITRQYARPDGSTMWIEVHSTGLHDHDGRLRSIYVQCLDVTVKHRHEEELRHQVRHDSLTGLLSRSALEADLLALLDTDGEQACVIYLDVDRFKTINDGAGHGAGDDVLRGLAERLTATVPAGALVARLGGDEFVVALHAPIEEGLRIGRAILATSAEPLHSAGGAQLAVSIGVATAQGADQAEAVLIAADTAMYAAKRAGGNRMEQFSQQMRVGVRERIVAEARLRRALDGDRVETLPVWFQPIVSTVTGLIVGAEALVRMRTPEGEILAPGHFIAVAEETGLVNPLGEHVLKTAVRHLLAWSDHLGYISVNVSPRQLAEPDFVPMLAALLAGSAGLDPSRLILEITETALLASSVDVQERLETIKTLGVRIALDDFGTGYSSLTWLQSVPADVVKLDRSFVAGLAFDAKKASIISAMLGLARSLGMSVIAEGVEDAEDWEALRAAECPGVQGYFFSRPLPAEAFEELLVRRLARAAA